MTAPARMLPLLLAISLAACGSAAETQARGQAQAEAAGALRMRVPRAAHSAVTLEDGRVLLIGGCVGESCEAGPDSATADIFDPATGRFLAGGALAEPRLSAAVARLASGEVLIAGGWSGPAVSSSVELFDPASGRSRRIGALAQARADIASVALADGRILLAGGYGGGRALDLVEIFDPRDSTIRAAGRLAVPRAGAGAALLADGKVLIAGGGANGSGGLVPTAAAEIFDPASGRSASTGALAQARYKHAILALPGGAVLVLGGSDARDRAGKLDTIERFEPGAGGFRPAGRMAEARFKIAGSVVALPDGRVLVGGGGRRAEIYDPATGRSALAGPDFGRILNFATATLLPSGDVLVAGGYGEEGISMHDRAWRLSPQAR